MRHFRRSSRGALQSHEFLMGEPLFSDALMFVGDGIATREPAADFEEAVTDEALDVPNRARLVKPAHEPEEGRPGHA